MVDIEALKTIKTIGIIGLGDMGHLYANRFSEAGWKVVGCDREDIFLETKKRFSDERFEVLKNGHMVSRCSDYIIYNVEAENLRKVVELYGPSTKVGAIVGGQTSCKTPEIHAFEDILAEDVKIVSLHSLHGPKVSTKDQPLVVINHRSNQEDIEFVEALISCLNSKVVFLSYKEHDKITADTQAVIHAAFLSMGGAWRSNEEYPWTTPRWVGGIENAKINITMRIFSNKWHVYAGLAITNPAAHVQILQFSKSVTELFSLMIQGKKDELRKRLYEVKNYVFSSIEEHDLLLDDNVLQKFSLGKVPPEGLQPNSHLSLLGMADCWYKLGIIPYDHNICSTPLFRVFLGVTEYLFCTPGLLDECIDVCISDNTFRADDLEFTIAARKWSTIVSFGSFDLYKKEFQHIQEFFKPMFTEANAVGNEMIKTIIQRVRDKEMKLPVSE